MKYALTNTLSIVHNTRVNNTVHTYTVYVTGMRAYVCTQLLILQYVSPLLFMILEIYKLHNIPYKKLHKRCKCYYTPIITYKV